MVITNTCFINKSVIREVVKAAMMPWKVWFSRIPVIAFLAGLIFMFLPFTISGISGKIFILGLILAFILLLVYIQKSRKMKREILYQIETVYGADEYQWNTELGADWILLRTAKKERTFLLCELERYYETQNLFILVFAGGFFLYLSKAGFSNGTEDDCRALLDRILPKNAGQRRRERIFTAIRIAVICFVAIAAVLVGMFLYVIRYRISDVDVSYSPDGVYELQLKAVGEADWPFGAAHGKLVLKEGKKTISKTEISIYDDGGQLRKESWDVTWESDCVRVILYGDEQDDEQITLYYDGEVTSKFLAPGEEGKEQKLPDDSQSREDSADSEGRPAQSTEDSADSEERPAQSTEDPGDDGVLYDEDGVPADDFNQRQKKEYQAIFDYLVSNGYLSDQDTLEFGISAKGWLYAAVNLGARDVDGETVYVRRVLIYDDSKNLAGQDEFVFEEEYYDEEGNSVYSTKILDFFLVDCRTFAVTDEQINDWH